MGIKARLLQPVDVASLAAFRIGFGALLLAATLRSLLSGSIERAFLIPKHFFKYWGFSWVTPWPGAGMYWHFGLMAACALGIMLGYRYRASVIGFGLCFGYAHLIDKTNYLNHYYLVLCVCCVMAALPLGGAWSLDALRRPEFAYARVPAWALWLLRAQFGLVYVFGGIAKLNADWLLRAQPLALWLPRNADLPLLGPLLGTAWAAHAMSIAGALFDLSIVVWLSIRRTRPWAYVAVVVFHLLTALLFRIGMFPYFMICGSLLFLPAEWPRALASRLRLTWASGESRATSVWASPRLAWAAAAFLALELVVPLRHWFYPGDPRWTEQGFRFAWNVMLMEKNGSVDFKLKEPSTGRVFLVAASDYFTPFQTAMMSPQPDMVLEAAHIVAADFRARGVKEPQVYVDAFASLNGRPMQRLIDARVDLARETDGLSNKTWILAMPTNNPPTLAFNTRSVP